MQKSFMWTNEDLKSTYLAGGQMTFEMPLFCQLINHNNGHCLSTIYYVFCSVKPTSLKSEHKELTSPVPGNLLTSLIMQLNHGGKLSKQDKKKSWTSSSLKTWGTERVGNRWTAQWLPKGKWTETLGGENNSLSQFLTFCSKQLWSSLKLSRLLNENLSYDRWASLKDNFNAIIDQSFKWTAIGQSIASLFGRFLA